MKRNSLFGTSRSRSLLNYVLLVFVLSIPFWLLGAVTEHLLPNEMPFDLPISSLMACSPTIAAVILVKREDGLAGVKKLLKRAFDFKRITGNIWYLPILFLMPAMMVLGYGLMKVMGAPLAFPQVPVLIVPPFFVVFFIAALGEELGWQGYAMDRLLERWNALPASIMLGIVWAVWHIIPLNQMNRTPTWIAWQCANMVATRILIVWLYNNTGKSVFATIIFHAMNNVTSVLLPTYGWHYDPFVAFSIAAVTASIVTFLWGPKTLARYRYARMGKSVQSGAAH